MAIHMPAASSSNAFDAFSRDVGNFSTPIAPAATFSTAGSHAIMESVTAEDGSSLQDLSSGFSNDTTLNTAQQAAPLDPLQTDMTAYTSNHHASIDDSLPSAPVDDSFTDTNPVSAMSEMSLNPEEMKGYAQLVFPDGEYLVTSTEIMLGRDERAQQILKEQARRLKKEQTERMMLQARQQAAELREQQGDDQSEILEGRPAPGLPSTFSEAGGIVNYEGSVDGMRKRRTKRRSFLLSRSSSTTSVAPASLHVYGAAASPWQSNEDSKCIFLPIHPFQAEDIRKISKEHLRIYYDGIDKHWKMEIKGNGAFVLNELYQETSIDPETNLHEATPRHFKRGDTVILTHNTEVLVTSLTFAFKLPHKRGMSTFDSDDDLENDSDDLQHISDDSTSEDDSDVEGQKTSKPDVPVKRPKIMLKASKPAVIEEHAAVPAGMGSKGGKKKPKEPGTASEQTPAPLPEQPSVPPVFDANSTLQHVPANELPEKRKGPGRPPKNGLVSKRDEGIIRRKMKEYEKRGERPPAYKDILAMVRAENRAKELAAKAAARGEPIPPGQEGFDLPVPDVERPSAAPTNTTPSALPDTVQSIEPADDFPADPDNQDSRALQPQRTYKSPSPMRPREEYTEEQMKRPTQTYYYILDEILSEDPEDAMELQQIYDKICKKYPFYKYVVESTGWQSSVRHNLKQNERFKPVSKQGKGWLWAIDPNIPLDKEKKKKPTPPPMHRPMHYDYNGIAQPNMAYGEHMQYGQQGYHQAAQHMNGQQVYRQPYTQANGGVNTTQTGQAGNNGQIHGHPPHAAVQHNTVQRSVSQAHSRPASHTPQPAANAPAGLPPAFQYLVEEIMRFRVEYLSPFDNDPAAYSRHERIFKRCVEWISQLHMRQNPDVKFENDEEQRVFQILEKMRHKFEQGGTAAPRPQQPQQTPPSMPADSSAHADATDGLVQAPAEQHAVAEQPNVSGATVQQAATSVPGPDTQVDAAKDSASVSSGRIAGDTDSAVKLTTTPSATLDVSASVSAGVKRSAEDDDNEGQVEEKRAKIEP